MNPHLEVVKFASDASALTLKDSSTLVVAGKSFVVEFGMDNTDMIVTLTEVSGTVLQETLANTSSVVADTVWMNLADGTYHEIGDLEKYYTLNDQNGEGGLTGNYAKVMETFPVINVDLGGGAANYAVYPDDDGWEQVGDFKDTGDGDKEYRLVKLETTTDVTATLKGDTTDKTSDLSTTKEYGIVYDTNLSAYVVREFDPSANNNNGGWAANSEFLVLGGNNVTAAKVEGTMHYVAVTQNAGVWETGANSIAQYTGGHWGFASTIETAEAGNPPNVAILNLAIKVNNDGTFDWPIISGVTAWPTNATTDLDLDGIHLGNNETALYSFAEDDLHDDVSAASYAIEFSGVTADGDTVTVKLVPVANNALDSGNAITLVAKAWTINPILYRNWFKYRWEDGIKVSCFRHCPG